MTCFLRRVAAEPYCRSMFRRRSLICLSVSMIGSAIRCGSAKAVGESTGSSLRGDVKPSVCGGDVK